MSHETIQFECLTPCFCAGVDQSKAEIRPSAIRGALRWWFRALGGTPEQEQEAFGGTEPVQASAVQIRISSLNRKLTGSLPTVGRGPGQIQPTDPLAYILYYASISGGEGANFGQGPRWQGQGSFGSGSTFTLHLRRLRKLSSETSDLLNLAIKAFKHYGAIGLRVTRGLGALQANTVTEDSRRELDNLLQAKGFQLLHKTTEHPNWISFMKEAGRFLKETLREDHGAGGNQKPPKATALGNINPTRQTSAVYLRPRKINGSNGSLCLTVFEAPHDRVLGEASKKAHSAQILKELNA